MNNDLISRSELKKATASFTDCDGFNPVWQIIDSAPSVYDNPYSDGREDRYIEGYEEAKRESARPQGEWKNVGFMVCECNNCKEQFHELEANNYCPNCGASMKGGAE